MAGYVRCIGSWQLPANDGGCRQCGRVLHLTGGVVVKAHKATLPQPENYWDKEEQERRQLDTMSRLNIGLTH